MSTFSSKSSVVVKAHQARVFDKKELQVFRNDVLRGAEIALKLPNGPANNEDISFLMGKFKEYGSVHRTSGYIGRVLTGHSRPSYRVAKGLHRLARKGQDARLRAQGFNTTPEKDRWTFRNLPFCRISVNFPKGYFASTPTITHYTVTANITI